MDFITVLPDQSIDLDLYRDLINSKRVTPYFSMPKYSSGILNFIRRVHLSFKISRIVNLPFKWIWYKDLLNELKPDECLIFSTLAVTRFDVAGLRKIKNHPAHPKMVLLIIDSLQADSPHLNFVRNKIKEFEWDLILSFDKTDCEKYGFQYLGYSYYSIDENIVPSDKFCDLYYIGANKGGREDIVNNVYLAAQKRGIVCNFNIVDPHMKSLGVGMTIYGKWIPYHSVLEDTLSSNCILEVLQEKQKTQSARYFEAICYNKKLLTNNARITELPFYDSRYMHIFNKIEEIDFDWVKRKEDIDYHYAGEFSPVRILDFVSNYFSSRV
jgi:hypothetical protein